ncbi:MAG: cbb3-type cytochrome c oxidase subunit 3 [Rhodocyclaceae bacterium]|nr:cbb3-type cytochrome c oxidase subunit 3 [Rhodocyclaceae bacterium]
MDINDFRSILTVLGLVCFLGIVAWAYSGRAKKGFDEAARLPFADEDMPDGHVRHPKEGTNNG